MDNLEQFFASAGSDAGNIIGRLGGNSSLVKMFLSKFPSDGSFSELKKALNDGDVSVAFRAAHTLKGVCANLGLQNLYEKASSVTEMLRGGSLDDAKKAFPSLEEEYKKVLESLKKIGIG